MHHLERFSLTLLRRSALLLTFCSVPLAPERTLAGPPLVPPPLLAACAKLSEGAPCTVRFPDKTLSGVCQALADRSIACLPPKRDKPPRPKPAPH